LFGAGQQEKLLCVGLLGQKLLQQLGDLLVGEALVGRHQAQQAALARGKQARALGSFKRCRQRGNQPMLLLLLMWASHCGE
jgi:hypothetical protein